ncbi:MAG: hypothetical protein KGQ41_08695 [Alphaproteobacteria bacterium]|nr:hypothetical protein [Alphaproteobacteria bacterium]
MPYNSSAFEKFKKNQKVASSAGADDPHVVKSRITVRGEVKAHAPAFTASDTPKAAIHPKEELIETEIVQTKQAKPFYARSWFLFLLFSVITTGIIPLVFKNQMDTLMGMADTVKTQTGVDAMSPDTYKAMFTGKPLPANRTAVAASDSSSAPPISAAPTPESTSTFGKIKQAASKLKGSETPAPTKIAAPTQLQTTGDLHEMVDQAAERAAQVTAQGPEASMQYIQQETERLNNMAKQFDNTYGAKK